MQNFTRTKYSAGEKAAVGKFDENKGRLSNNEVFGFSMVLEEKMSSI